MRARNLATFVALTALIYSLFPAVTAIAEKSTIALDGQAHVLEISKSVPGQLNYQGFLVNAADSSAVSATLEMTLKLFDSETKGAELWSETHSAVEVSNGLFQILLGSVTPFSDGFFDGSDMWLQTEVGVEVLAPRKPLVSVAYSHRTNSAEMLLDNTLTDLDDRWVNEVDLDHLDAADGDPANAVYVDADGKVGVGTTSPLTELDVNGSVNATTYYGDGSNLTGIAGTPDADWAIDGDNVYHETGNVGIGTASPSYPLDVNGDVHATSYYGDGSNLTGISGTTDNDWTISGNNIYSSVSGNVGVGTSSPSAKLDVSGEINTDSVYQIDGRTVLSTRGDEITSVGSAAGANNTGRYSVFVGDSAGYNNQKDNNVFLGRRSGRSNTTGFDNTFVGAESGLNNTEGYHNTFIGDWAGENNTTGSQNTFLGARAGIVSGTGSANTFVGSGAGYHASTGSFNIFIGYQAGCNNHSGSNNVFIGHWAGYNEQGSDKLIIANYADTSSVLIYGDFSSGNVGLGTMSPNAKLEVQGAQNDLALIKINQRGARQYTGLRLDRDDAENWFVGMSAFNDNLIFRQAASNNYMVIDTTGNVGIGTASPGYKLDVAGDINTTGEIRRNGSTYIHPDYVFEPEYELISLGELKEFVAEYKHLPGMPSAEEVKEDGIKLFEQNRLVLEKLEESYLYILALEERITQLEDSQR